MWKKKIGPAPAPEIPPLQETAWTFSIFTQHLYEKTY